MATTTRRLVLDGKPSIPAATDEAAMRAAVAQVRTRLEKLDAAVNRSFATLDASSPQKSLESLQNQIAILSKQLENLAAQVDAATSARQPTYLAMQMGDDAEDGQPGPPGPPGERGERGYTLLLDPDEHDQHLVIGPPGPQGPPGSMVVLDLSESCGDDFPVGFATATPGALPGAVAAASETSPAQITSNQNDYAGLDAGTFALRLNSDAAREITGLAGGSQGRLVWVTNFGSFSITLKNQDAGSIAANRFGFGADVVLGVDVSSMLRYDGASSRWRTI